MGHAAWVDAAVKLNVSLPNKRTLKTWSHHEGGPRRAKIEILIQGLCVTENCAHNTVSTLKAETLLVSGLGKC